MEGHHRRGPHRLIRQEFKEHEELPNTINSTNWGEDLGEEGNTPVNRLITCIAPSPVSAPRRPTFERIDMSAAGLLHGGDVEFGIDGAGQDLARCSRASATPATSAVYSGDGSASVDCSAAVVASSDAGRRRVRIRSATERRSRVTLPTGR